MLSYRFRIKCTSTNYKLYVYRSICDLACFNPEIIGTTPYISKKKSQLWEGSGDCQEGNFTISQLTSSLKWHRLTCLLLPLISTVHASVLWKVFIISLNSSGFIAKGCLSLRYSRERRVIFLLWIQSLSKTTCRGLTWMVAMQYSSLIYIYVYIYFSHIIFSFAGWKQYMTLNLFECFILFNPNSKSFYFC